jgi:Rrf2 family cysteine metabolism transcriptional repressor
MSNRENGVLYPVSPQQTKTIHGTANPDRARSPRLLVFPPGPPYDPRFDFHQERGLRLSKRTEYGLRAVVQLARLEPRTYVQSKDLSSGQEKLPNKFLEAVLLALRRGGFLESKVGSGGGYRLSRHPRDISVGELIRRLEGRLTVKEDITPGEQSPGQIAFRLLNEKLTAALDEVLDAMTLEQLMEHVARVGNQQQEMYYI